MSKAFTRKKLKFFDRLIRDRNLNGMDPCVAWRLLDRISVEGNHCYPSLETVAAELDCNEKTVRRSINALEENGWFDIKRGGGGRKKVHRYWPNYENRTELSTLGTEKTRQDCPKKPDRTVPENRTKVSNESLKEPFKEPPGSRVPSPKGGAAPLRTLLGDTSPDVVAYCLQGGASGSALPSFSGGVVSESNKAVHAKAVKAAAEKLRLKSKLLESLDGGGCRRHKFNPT